MAGNLDRTLPGVYIDIEDKSETIPTIRNGRSGYIILVSDRGPHNKVVELNSKDDLYDLFGRPDFTKYGDAHYIADRHLTWSSTLYVCRVAMMSPLGDSSEDDCMTIANGYIKSNPTSVDKIIIGNDIVIPSTSDKMIGNYKFSLNNTDVITDNVGDSNFNIGDYIYLDGFDSKNAIPIKSKTDNGTEYRFVLEKNYVGISNSITTNTNLIISSKLTNSNIVAMWDFSTTPVITAVISNSTIADFLDIQNILPIGSNIYPEQLHPAASTNPTTVSVEDCVQIKTITHVNVVNGIGNIIITADDTSGKLSTNIGNVSDYGPDSISFYTPVSFVTKIGNFIFTYDNNFVNSDIYVINTFKVGNWIFPVNTDPKDARQIIAVDTVNKRYLLDEKYTGEISKIGNAVKYIPEFTIPSNHFSFSQNSNIVSTNIESLSLFSVGMWIYPETLDYTYARQIIEIDENKVHIILDEDFTGDDQINVKIKEYVPFSVNSIKRMKSFLNADIHDKNVVWYFIGKGPGDYYNRYFIRGVRNFSMERVQMDKDNKYSLFPYGFMDIAIYRKNDDYTTTLMEGPWTISLFANWSNTKQPVRNPYSGEDLYIATVINRRSKLIQVVEGGAIDLMSKIGNKVPNEIESKSRRYVQDLFYSGQSVNGSVASKLGFELVNGEDGSLFDQNGNLSLSDSYRALIAQAYNGSLESLDNDDSVQNIIHDINPEYNFDYVLCGNYGTMVNGAAKDLVVVRDDCLLLTDTGRFTVSGSEDLEIRSSAMDYNSYNVAIYTQYKELEDIFTGKRFFVSPVYHAIDRHLYTDARYWVSEPPAGIEKGAIENIISMAYMPKRAVLTKMYNAELNTTIKEPDGTYIISQFTTWKKESMLKRQHVVKFIHYIKKNIPPLLKDLLQRKGSPYIISQAEQRINNFMEPFVDRGEGDNYSSISQYTSLVSFDELRSEMNIALKIRPLRAIERINVRIIVE